MKREGLMGQYSRVGLIVAAFAFTAGIIAAPLMPWLWSPMTIVAQR